MVPDLQWILVGLPAFILAGTVHEYMHAWTAKKLGDYTATIEGRLTLNPLAHLDPFGLLLMIIAKFGWMKPVPVNSYNFKNPVVGMAITALAGPASNLVMATAAAIVYNALFAQQFLALLPSSSPVLGVLNSALISFIYVNIVLMLFNLIPIPPLDGSRIVKVIMPKSLQYYWDLMENYSGILLLLILLPFSPLSQVIGTFLTSGILYFMNLLIL
ncbi:MAG: site-2 protease family protein [Candidatus Dojkabacteria bacterium]|nr:MAG: site-2 protease family protein [Candidatus Dojkabacteria bacterium]